MILANSKRYQNLSLELLPDNHNTPQHLNLFTMRELVHIQGGQCGALPSSTAPAPRARRAPAFRAIPEPGGARTARSSPNVFRAPVSASLSFPLSLRR